MWEEYLHKKWPLFTSSAKAIDTIIQGGGEGGLVYYL